MSWASQQKYNSSTKNLIADMHDRRFGDLSSGKLFDGGTDLGEDRSWLELREQGGGPGIAVRIEAMAEGRRRGGRPEFFQRDPYAESRR